MADSRGALPGAPTDGVDAAISGLTADLCDKTQGNARAAQDRELAARREFGWIRPISQANSKKGHCGRTMVLDSGCH